MTHDLAQLVRDAAAGTGARQVRAAGRLMSMIEDDPTRLPALVVAARPYLASSPLPLGEGREGGCKEPPRLPRIVLGITGAPGSGKSTLTDALLGEYRRRFPQRKIGVVAVDPSSPFTGGAVLGDRVRMMRHTTDPMIFVRSMASRGHLGGLALGVRGVIQILALIGCDLVILETVGVGQSEVEVAGIADLTAIIFAPGQGDSIQLLKAGLMEIGDLFVINKADRPGAAELHRQLLSVLKLGVIEEHCGAHHGIGLPQAASRGLPDSVGETAASPELGLMRSRPMPDVQLVSAAEHTGIASLLDLLEKKTDDHHEDWAQRRDESMFRDIRDSILEAARQRLERTLGRNGTAHGQVARVLAGDLSIEELADDLLRRTAGAPHANAGLAPGRTSNSSSKTEVM
ncbi:MAG: hypothetical protein WD042_17775 [Phycisphaeraceae bacterium]